MSHLDATSLRKPCEYCGCDLPLGVDKPTRRIRSYHFRECKKRPLGPWNDPPTHTPPCEHAYDYQGLVTWPSEDPLPGSGARARIYADAFFCTRCCALRLMNERQMGSTYTKAIDGAVPYERRPT